MDLFIVKQNIVLILQGLGLEAVGEVCQVRGDHDICDCLDHKMIVVIVATTK